MGFRVGFACSALLANFALGREAFGQASVPQEQIVLRDVVFEANDADAELRVLERNSFGGSYWRSLCKGSCRTVAAVGAPYVVVGAGLIPSRKFAIYPNPGPFIVRASMGSRTRRTLGIVMIPTGGAVTLTGLIWGTACVDCNDDEKSGARTAGLTSLIGVLVLLAGVGLASDDTSLDFGPRATASSPGVHLGRFATLTPSGVVF